MNFRAIAAVIAGGVLWYVLFMALGVAIGLVWPDYQQAAAEFFEREDFGLFSFPMMLMNLLLFAIAGKLTGWFVAALGASRKPALVLAGLFFALALFDHYYLVWNVLPSWYNLLVPWIVGGSIYLGSRLKLPFKPSRTS